MWQETSHRGLAVYERISRQYLCIIIAALVAFAVTCITNSTIVAAIERYNAVSHTANSITTLDSGRLIAYFIIPTKELLFLGAVLVLARPAVEYFWRERAILFEKNAVRATIITMLIVLALMATLTGVFYGVGFAKAAVQPFGQEPDHLYRRILPSAIAHYVFLTGIYFYIFFWFVMFLAIRVMDAFLAASGISLGIWSRASLLTVGIVGGSYNFPGYPEIMFLIFGLIALMEFQRDGKASYKQVSLFALSLLTHEAGAVLLFGTMTLFLFNWRSWLPLGVVAVCYVAAWIGNFGFDPMAAAQIHTTMHTSAGEIEAWEYFRQSPLRVLLGILFSYKLVWVFVPMGLMYAPNIRMTLFIVTGIAISLCFPYFAIDYTRDIGLSTVMVLLSFTLAHHHFRRGVVSAVLVANLVIPSLCIEGNESGVMMPRGIYSLASRQILDFSALGINPILPKL